MFLFLLDGMQTRFSRRLTQKHSFLWRVLATVVWLGIDDCKTSWAFFWHCQHEGWEATKRSKSANYKSGLRVQSTTASRDMHQCPSHTLASLPSLPDNEPVLLFLVSAHASAQSHTQDLRGNRVAGTRLPCLANPPNPFRDVGSALRKCVSWRWLSAASLVFHWQCASSFSFLFLFFILVVSITGTENMFRTHCALNCNWARGCVSRFCEAWEACQEIDPLQWSCPFSQRQNMCRNT